jgi:hypothetical protein
VSPHLSHDMEIVTDVIRKVYQDASTSALDVMCAEDILTALRAAGWAVT